MHTSPGKSSDYLHQTLVPGEENKQTFSCTVLSNKKRQNSMDTRQELKCAECNYNLIYKKP